MSHWYSHEDLVFTTSTANKVSQEEKYPKMACCYAERVTATAPDGHKEPQQQQPKQPQQAMTVATLDKMVRVWCGICVYDLCTFGLGLVGWLGGRCSSVDVNVTQPLLVLELYSLS